DGGNWHCSASVGSRQRRVTTKTDSLSLAKKIAEDWYLGLRGKAPPMLVGINAEQYQRAGIRFRCVLEIDQVTGTLPT
ncbi:hypothetical protein, partial [Novosphingobium sp. 18050]